MKVKMDGKTKDVKTLWYDDGRQFIIFIDQRKLPHEFTYFEAKGIDDLTLAIKDMVVRGAPAIGVAAAFGMAQAWAQGKDLEATADLLIAQRPTAHDLAYGVKRMKEAAAKGDDVVAAAKAFAHEIETRCKKIGEHGEPLIKDGARILTHCNAGALATVDHGTALAPIRAAHAKGKKLHVWVDETRPRLQGAFLTAWEMFNEDIPCSLIADNAAGHFMAKGEVDLVIVGADRITANGDFANKIGTYEKAVVAHENGVPFYVAAPISTYDPATLNGSGIPIEERDPKEVLEVLGKRITAEGVTARNPAFDVTPSKFVTGYITEMGVLDKAGLKRLV